MGLRRGGLGRWEVAGLRLGACFDDDETVVDQVDIARDAHEEHPESPKTKDKGGAHMILAISFLLLQLSAMVEDPRELIDHPLDNLSFPLNPHLTILITHDLM